jgi:hypothetical protein
LPAARIVEAADVFGDRHFNFPPFLLGMSADQLCFNGLEERLDRRRAMTESGVWAV